MKTYTVIVDYEGTQRWYVGEKLHRDNAPAIEYADGSKVWYQNGVRHRTDGPAVEDANGSKFWYRNGNIHRIDGPAIECANGTKEWYLEGIEYTEQEWRTELDKRNKPKAPCNGKTVEIEGVKYKLVEIV